MTCSRPYSLCDTYGSMEWTYASHVCVHACICMHIWTSVCCTNVFMYTPMYPCFYISSSEAQAQNWKQKSIKASQFTSFKAETAIKFATEWATNMNIVINQNLALFRWHPGFVAVLLCCINLKGDPVDELLCWNINVPRQANNTAT